VLLTFWYFLKKGKKVPLGEEKKEWRKIVKKQDEKKRRASSMRDT
jgi:SH3-like domain-containing protein